MFAVKSEPPAYYEESLVQNHNEESLVQSNVEESPVQSSNEEQVQSPKEEKKEDSKVGSMFNFNPQQANPYECKICNKTYSMRIQVVKHIEKNLDRYLMGQSCA